MARRDVHRRYLNALLGVVVPLVLTYAVVTAPSRFGAAIAESRRTQYSDLGVFLDTAASLYGRNERSPYVWGPAGVPNLNAPHTHVLLWPLVDLPREQAYALWLVVGFASVVAAVFRVWSAMDRTPSLRWLLVGLAVVGVSGLTTTLLITGQIYPLLAWPLAEAFLAARRQRWNVAAILLGVLITIKPPLALLALWLWWKKSATVLPTLVAAGAAIMLGIALFGLDAYAGWINSLANAGAMGHWTDGSIYQALVRAFAPTRYFEEVIVLPGGIIRAMWLVAAAVTVVDAARWTRRVDDTAAWVGLLVAGWLVAPKGWMVMGWLAVPLAVAVVAEKKDTLPVRLAALLLLFQPNAIGTWGQPNAWLTVPLGSMYLWTWLLFYIGIRGSALTAMSLRGAPRAVAARSGRNPAHRAASGSVPGHV